MLNENRLWSGSDVTNEEEAEHDEAEREMFKQFHVADLRCVYDCILFWMGN